MCLTGAFVIPLIIDPGVVAAVVSQPAIPYSLSYRATGLGGGDWMRRLNISDEQLQAAQQVAARDNKSLLLQRFADDRLCPRERLDRLAEVFGAQAQRVEYPEPSALRRAFNPPHALLTEEYDRAGPDNPATRNALHRVLAFLHRHLG